MRRGFALRSAVPVVLLMTALATTAGCQRGDRAAAGGRVGGAAAPSSTRTANSGLGGGSGPAPTTSRQSGDDSRGVASGSDDDSRTPVTSGSDDDSKMPVPTRAPRIPKWSEVVEPCPHDGQKVVVRTVLSTYDVTADGVEDTLVLRGCEASTSYWPSTVEVFDGTARPEKPRRIGALLKGSKDVPWVTELRVIKGYVVLPAYGLSKGAPAACPDLNLTYRFRYTGGKFQQTWRDAGKAAECLPVG